MRNCENMLMFQLNCIQSLTFLELGLGQYLLVPNIVPGQPVMDDKSSEVIIQVRKLLCCFSSEVDIIFSEFLLRNVTVNSQGGIAY